jgi:hypothetical protein
MIEEIWKDIVNYIGLYAISNYGRIKSFKNNHGTYREKILRPAKNTGRSPLVTLCKNGLSRNYSVHKLVMEAFVGPLPSGMEICHNDGNGENNFVDNLRYDTHKNNEKDKIRHGTFLCGSKRWNAKLDDNKIIEIIKLAKEYKLSQRKIAKIYDVSQSVIWAIINKKKWKYIKRKECDNGSQGSRL